VAYSLTRVDAEWIQRLDITVFWSLVHQLPISSDHDELYLNPLVNKEGFEVSSKELLLKTKKFSNLAQYYLKKVINFIALVKYKQTS
jgi:hypothetical protein